MSRKNRAKGKREVAKSEGFGFSPFESLEPEGLPQSPAPLPVSDPKPKKVNEQEQVGKGDRLEIRREKSGRGGKTVTTIAGFSKRINVPMRATLLKRMKTKLGTGGTWVGDCMELQGDKREEVFSWLSALGFKPILAGG